jgi:hypothetical protein
VKSLLPQTAAPKFRLSFTGAIRGMLTARREFEKGNSGQDLTRNSWRAAFNGNARRLRHQVECRGHARIAVREGDSISLCHISLEGFLVAFSSRPFSVRFLLLVRMLRIQRMRVRAITANPQFTVTR